MRRAGRCRLLLGLGLMRPASDEAEGRYGEPRMKHSAHQRLQTRPRPLSLCGGAEGRLAQPPQRVDSETKPANPQQNRAEGVGDCGQGVSLIGLLDVVPERDLHRHPADHEVDKAPRGKAEPGQADMASLPDACPADVAIPVTIYFTVYRPRRCVTAAPLITHARINWLWNAAHDSRERLLRNRTPQ